MADAGGTMDDDLLMEGLRRAVARIDPVPPEVTLAGRSALAWRRMDADLAELLHDSALDASALAGVRGPQDARLLTFEGSGLTVEVEVIALRETRRVVGQVVPPRAGAVRVRHSGGTIEARADDLGRFEADGAAPGPLSIRVEPDDGSDAVETGWVPV